MLDQHWTDPEVHHAAGGHVAIYTRRKNGVEGANQDAACLLWLDASTIVMAVADGAGGLPQGDRAAALAVESLSRAVEQGETEGLRGRILDGFEQANRAVLGLGVGAATTLSVAEISDGKVRSYHAGDSMVLVCGGRGKIKQLTLAHAPVSYGVEAGMISDKEALFHEDRNLVSNCLGSADMRIEIGPVTPLAPRDTVLIASDGLHDNMMLEEIVDTMRKGSIGDRASGLAHTASDRMCNPRRNLPSKPDDLTFLIYRPSSKGA